MAIPFNQRLETVCREKNNSLCIGLDIDPDKFPSGADTSLSGMESFGKDVIDGSIDFCPVYKPNFAFFERFGSQGFSLLERLVDHINGRAIVIADAKRGDIGNTSHQYATAILDGMGCDAITISPYMGRDAIKPFIKNPEKGVFILCRTSNNSGVDLQNLAGNGKRLFETVAENCAGLNKNDNVGLVVGATVPKEIDIIRQHAPGLPLLIPGVGAQGGDLQASLTAGNTNGVALINVSRGISFAGDQSEEAIHVAAKDYIEKMRTILG